MMVAVMALGAIHAIGTPPFAPPDETSHVAYALAVSEWEIPHIADFPEHTPIPGMPDHLSVWTANHPPGSYALLAVPLRLGLAAGAPLAGFWAARMMNVVAFAIAVVLAARIAATLLPRRPRVVLTAAMVVGLVPYFVHISATAYTDAIALVPTLGMVTAAVGVLVRGPSRRSLIVMVALSAVCALMRSQSLVVVLLAGAAFALAVLLHGEGTIGRRLLRGVLSAALIGLAAVVAAGWFYVGNIGLYGDPSGSEALFELHNREPRGEFWPYLTHMHHVRYQQFLLWGFIEGAPDGGQQFFTSGQWVTNAWRLLVGVLAAAAAAAGARLGRRMPSPGRWAAWGLLSVLLVTLYVLMITFTANGGSPHSRYVWAAFPLVAVVLAVGLDTLRVPLPDRWRWRGIDAVPVATFAGLYAILQPQLHGWPRALEVFEVAAADRGFSGAVLDSFAARDLSTAVATVVLVVLWLGLALLAVGLVTTATHVDPVGGPAGSLGPAADEEPARGIDDAGADQAETSGDDMQGDDGLATASVSAGGREGADAAEGGVTS